MTGDMGGGKMRLEGQPMPALKLDLHTHCGEASMRSAPHIKSVRAIIAAARARRLDGIAITDHHNRLWGLKAREIAREHFEGRLVIITIAIETLCARAG